MKILVVDDERAIRNSLKEILSDEGYNVDVAEDGATAIDMAEKERYDVISATSRCRTWKELRFWKSSGLTE